MSANDTGRVVIITGAAGGIGRVLVAAALDAGYRVALLDRDKGRLDQMISELKECNQGDGLLACIVDVADENSCTIAIEQVIIQFGRLDGLVNAAGIGMVVVRDSHMVEPVRFDEVSSDHWDQFFDINAKGPFLMAKGALPFLAKGGWGRIVNVTTSMDTMHRSGFCPYGPSKAALEASTAIWAQELDGTGVTVNVLTPGGPTDTAMLGKELPFSRDTMIKPEVMGPPLKWLLSSKSDGINGRRFIGRFWDPALSPSESAEAAGGPVAWPGAGQAGVWPTSGT